MELVIRATSVGRKLYPQVELSRGIEGAGRNGVPTPAVS